jgi:hypothetical protein
MLNVQVELTPPVGDHDRNRGCGSAKTHVLRLYGENMTERSPVRLTVIPEPKEGTRVIIDLTDNDANSTVFIDASARDVPPMLCGDCEAVLVEGIERGTLESIILHCPRCGAYNDTP